MRDRNVVAAAALAIVDRMNSAMVSPGRGLNDVAALVHIRERPGESIRFLARVLDLTHSGGVRLVDRLAAGGLVAPEMGSDRRSVRLFLTPAGEREVRAALSRRQAAVESILEILAGRENAHLVSAAEKLLAALTSDRWGARFICRMCDYPSCIPNGCPVDGAATATEKR